MSLHDTIQQGWRRRGMTAVLLLPLTLLFGCLAALRRLAYRSDWLRSEHLPVPVVVIGNITAGGSGKTPLTLWLAQQLQQAGRRPGIVSRGYAADGDGVLEVTVDSDPTTVGDEPLLLRRRSGVPLFVGRDRVAAGRTLLATHPDCDVILSDDGLQHYRLARDFEIAVIDERGLMNGWLLPSGPLREPPRRLATVDALVLNGDDARSPSFDAPANANDKPAFRMTLSGTVFQRLDDPAQTCTAADLAGARLAALAGIAVPERFFGHLERLGLNFTRHAFADHHRFTAADLTAIDADALLMTEKDAVKCAVLVQDQRLRPIWVLPVTAQVEPQGLIALIEQQLEHRLVEKLRGSPSA